MRTFCERLGQRYKHWKKAHPRQIKRSYTSGLSKKLSERTWKHPDAPLLSGTTVLKDVQGSIIWWHATSFSCMAPMCTLPSQTMSEIYRIYVSMLGTNGVLLGTIFEVSFWQRDTWKSPWPREGRGQWHGTMDSESQWKCGTKAITSTIDCRRDTQPGRF